MSGDGKTALVSGASRGIGRGIAFDLAAQGFGLTVTARRAPALAPLADELREAGAPKVVHVAADLADRESAGAVAAVHEQAFGTMDALVLSGGVGTAGRIADLLPHRVDKTLAVNLVSVFGLVRTSLPMLRTAAAAPSGLRTGARVILLSALTGVYAEPELAVYGASKAALISLAETLNAEESGHGVMAPPSRPATSTPTCPTG
jgi:short-subunit dehydrogenase